MHLLNAVFNDNNCWSEKKKLNSKIKFIFSFINIMKISVQNKFLENLEDIVNKYCRVGKSRINRGFINVVSRSEKCRVNWQLPN